MEKFACLALHLGLALGAALLQPGAWDAVPHLGDASKRDVDNPFSTLGSRHNPAQPVSIDLKIYDRAGQAELQWYGEITIGAPPQKL